MNSLGQWLSSMGKSYLRPPNAEDIARLLQKAEERGFPGMISSIDCMHWEWEKCPTAWHGQYRGHFKKPTIILEAVASYDLRIWHAFLACQDLIMILMSYIDRQCLTTLPGALDLQ